METDIQSQQFYNKINMKKMEINSREKKNREKNVSTIM